MFGSIPRLSGQKTTYLSLGKFGIGSGRGCRRTHFGVQLESGTSPRETLEGPDWVGDVAEPFWGPDQVGDVAEPFWGPHLIRVGDVAEPFW